MDKDAFAEALRAHMGTAGISQRALGEAVAADLERPQAFHQSVVSDWMGRGNPPDPDVVCAIERVLDLAPGALTLHLGYLPPEARGEVLTVLEAIDADPQLTPKERAALKAAYAAFVSPDDGSTALTSSSSRNG